MSTAHFKWADNVNESTRSAEFVNIAGLRLELPSATNDFNAAIVTLNVTEPYAEGGTSNGIMYQITAGNTTSVTGGFTNGTSQNGRSPVTLVTLISLSEISQSVQAQWRATGGATAKLGGGQASLSAILVNI